MPIELSTQFLNQINAAKDQYSGEDTTVRFDRETKEVSFGTWKRLGSRDITFRQNNTTLRQQLVDALRAEYNVDQNQTDWVAALPQSVKNALKIGDFGLNKSGQVTSNKPLTARRVSAIITAVIAERANPSQLNIGGQGFHPRSVSESNLLRTAAQNAAKLRETNLKSGINDALKNGWSTNTQKALLGHIALTKQMLAEDMTIDTFVVNKRGKPITDDEEIDVFRQQGTFTNLNQRTEEELKSALTFAILTQLAKEHRNPGGNSMQFTGDVGRTLFINEQNGKAFHAKFSQWQQAQDQMAQEVTGDPNATFANLSPADRNRVNLLKSLLTQGSEMALAEGVTCALFGTRELGVMQIGGNKGGTPDESVYSYRFEPDGGVSVTITRSAHPKTVQLGPAIIERDEEMTFSTAFTAHISGQEVDRLFSILDDQAFETATNVFAEYTRTNNFTPPAQSARMNLPEQFHVNMEVRAAIKVIV